MGSWCFPCEKTFGKPQSQTGRTYKRSLSFYLGLFSKPPNHNCTLLWSMIAYFSECGSGEYNTSSPCCFDDAKTITNNRLDLTHSSGMHSLFNEIR
eukprot:UN06263